MSEFLNSLQVNPVYIAQLAGKQELTFSHNALASFKIAVLLSGQYELVTDSEKFVVQAGDAVLMSPFVRYKVSSIQEDGVTPSLFVIHFDLPIKERDSFIRQFHLNGTLLAHHVSHPLLVKVIEHCCHHHQNNSPLAYQYITILTHIFLLEVMEKLHLDYLPQEIVSRKEFSAERVVHQCIEYLDSNMKKKVTAHDLCEHLSISQSYLFRCFKSYLDQSPKQFIMHYRFKEIETELKHNKRSINELSERYGFSSVYTFSNSFKRHFGLSPREYRSQFSQKEHTK